MDTSIIIGSIPTTSCASNDSTRIPSISAEKWEQVFSNLNQREVAKVRLVCPYWRTIIDTNYKFSIKIKKRSFEELPVPFKVKSCHILRLKKDVKQIFKYPFNIDYLKLAAKVNPPTLQNIFTETTNLKELYFHNTRDFGEKDIYVPGKPIHFKNLWHLTIVHHTAFTLPLTINIEHIFLCEMPLIERIYVTICGRWNHLESILPNFFRFLAKHRKTIKVLQASFTPEIIYASQGATPLLQEIFNEEETHSIIQKLQDPEFQIRTLVLGLATQHSSLWEIIIEHQKKLVTFYTQCTEDKVPFTISRVPFNAIKPTLDRNASTLENLHLECLALEENQNRDVDPRLFFPIDGLVFRDLSKLRRLILKRVKEDYVNHRAIQPAVATITNIHAIPSELLEVLEIKRFYCETSELETLVEKSQRLKMVIFHDTGITNGKGVTTRIIDNLTKKSDIEMIDVCPYKIPHNNEERKKLKQLKKQHPQAFRLFGNHYYFNFDRLRKGLKQVVEYHPHRHPFYL